MRLAVGLLILALLAVSCTRPRAAEPPPESARADTIEIVRAPAQVIRVPAATPRSRHGES